MLFTEVGEKRAAELKQMLADKFNTDDCIECSFGTGLEILRRQGSIYAIVDMRVIAVESIAFAEWLTGAGDAWNGSIYCFDDGIANGSWMLTFTKQSPDGLVCCRYNDWRTDCQGELFKGERLYRRKYRTVQAESDHDHCAMCWAKFSGNDGDLQIGWCEDDRPASRSRWICDECFCDLKDLLKWQE